MFSRINLSSGINFLLDCSIDQQLRGHMGTTGNPQVASSTRLIGTGMAFLAKDWFGVAQTIRMLVVTARYHVGWPGTYVKWMGGLLIHGHQISMRG